MRIRIAVKKVLESIVKRPLRKKIWHVWWRFKGLIIVYIAFCWFWFHLKSFPSWYIPLWENKLGLYNGFFKSWLPSFSEDLLFFGLGFLGLVLSTKLLKDESFGVKISALANGTHVNDRVENQLKIEIERLLSFNKKYDVVVKIKEVDSDKKNIFVHTDMRCEIANMCDDDEIPTPIRTYVEPGLKVNGKFGSIYKFTVIHKPFLNSYDKNLPKPIDIFDGYKYDLDSGPYLRELDYPIHKNGTVEWRLCFDLWIPLNGDEKKSDNWFFNSISGYTENYSFVLENELNETIKFKYKYKGREPFVTQPQEVFIDNALLESQTSRKIVSNLVFHKLDKFEIYLYT